MNYSSPGSSVHEILQARILDWVDVPFSRGSSQPKDRIQVSLIAVVFFTAWATRETQRSHQGSMVLRMDIIEIPKTILNRLQQYMNWELPDVQAGFRKDRGTRDQIANIRWIIQKPIEFQKNIYFCFIDYAEDFVWITTNCGKLWKRWEYQTTWPAFWETCMQVRKPQLEMDMEQQTGSK